MTVKKISISLDAEVFERAKRAAHAEGMPLSTWLSQAAEEAAGLAEARDALAEYIEVYGEPDAEAMAKTRARLDAAGVGQWETSEDAAARMAALAKLRGELPSDAARRAG
jgi:predicted nucleic acid-binding protein